ncbi:DUF6894 family protein [Bradyrhizobium sp. SYSU BS000235]|jgi:hypothetical protein|uniref:DUF6894 family protein n=1 Tax=Bradyrhizobium sp. SYSU BS000235 TaxID=3411332 RepID=UPI003C76F92F
MPRYFFNIRHDRLYEDVDGLDLDNKDSAWEAATRSAGDHLKELDGQLRPGHDWRMEVTDEFANPIFEILVRAEKK